MTLDFRGEKVRKRDKLAVYSYNGRIIFRSIKKGTSKSHHNKRLSYAKKGGNYVKKYQRYTGKEKRSL